MQGFFMTIGLGFTVAAVAGFLGYLIWAYLTHKKKSRAKQAARQVARTNHRDAALRRLNGH